MDPLPLEFLINTPKARFKSVTWHLQPMCKIIRSIPPNIHNHQVSISHNILNNSNNMGNI